MRKKTMMPINGKKLRELVLSKGHITVISEELGYSRTALGIACKSNKISPVMARALELGCNIPYEKYKPEEPKPEPKPEEPVKETAFTNRSEQCLITLVAMVGEMRNNMIVLNEKLDKLIELWGEN